MTKIAHVSASALFSLLSFAFPKVVVGQVYEITQLDPPATNLYNFSAATAINNDGVVVGNGSAMYTTDLMLIWRPGQLYPEQKYFYGYNRTTAEGINDSGQYVGYGPADDGIHGFLMSTDLGRGRTKDINNLGQVVGWTYDSLYIYKDGVFDYLPTSNWGSEANAINDSGVAAGYWYTDCAQDCYSQACIFRNDEVILIGTLGGTDAEGADINNRGDVVGWSCVDTDCTQYLGFLWRNGVMTPLPSFDGARASANAINELGVIVGDGYYAGGNTQHAFIYDTIAGLRDLNQLIPADLGWELISATDINERGQIVGLGKRNGLTRAFLLNPAPLVVLRDGKGDSIPNITVTISRVSYDPPIFTEEVIDTETSDLVGQIPLDTSLIHDGDSIKVTLRTHIQPAVKHQSWLGTMYTVHLDNASFDSAGAMSYTEITGATGQEIVLGHTTVAWNLLVSVEWDADLAYLNSLQSGFRIMSNYLYDVTDGQVRLDTVMIYDARQFWDSADVCIYASNTQWPEAFVADRANGWGSFSATATEVLRFPRMFYFNSPDVNRNMTWSAYPYNWTVALTQYDADGPGGNPPESKAYCPVRTLAHEFGHYALGFRDEYLDTLKVSVYPGPNTPGGAGTVYDFGMMDDQLKPTVAQSSELSSGLQYTNVNHRITRHWQKRGFRSCWDWFEYDIGEFFDTAWCEIVKPTERGAGTAMFKGPNDSIPSLDYDVGALVYFPIGHAAPATFTARVAVFDAVSGDSIPDINVLLKQTASGRMLDQGNSADTGRIRVLGCQVGDTIRAAGRVVIEGFSALSAGGDTWMYGEAAFGSSGTSRLGNRFRSALSGDSMDIFLAPVSGNYPAICEAQLSGDFALITLNPFSSPPSVVHTFDGGVATAAVEMAPTTAGYSVSLSDSLAATGSLTIWALDGSGQAFFFDTRYTITSVDSVPLLREVFGPGVKAELTIDAANLTTRRVMILASPYPVIRDGLLGDARQAGECYSIDAEPVDQLPGYSRLTIRYADSDLGNTPQERGVEPSLRVFAWDAAAGQWELVGGEADTENNEISAVIDGAGVYAAFTTQSPTDVDDEIGEAVIPHRFELRQNYPNPFNPVTTIEYSVPSRAHVTIEIFNVLGQKVRTLVNEAKPAGNYRIAWDGTDQMGRSVSTGVYLYRFQAGDHVQTKKMLLLK